MSQRITSSVRVPIICIFKIVQWKKVLTTENSESHFFKVLNSLKPVAVYSKIFENISLIKEIQIIRERKNKTVWEEIFQINIQKG